VESLPKLFGSSGVRGLVNVDLTPILAAQIGMAIAAFWRARFTQVFPENTELSTVDGVRLSLEDGWIFIRASGTEPVIRLTVKGESLRTAKKIMEKGVMLVEQSAGKVK
jgi:phosphomannomutase